MNLFEKTEIGKLKLKNRFVRASVWMKAADAEGHLTTDIYNYYTQLAKGGVGLILTGYANISDEEKPNPGMMGIYNDVFIPEHRKLTEKVHREGAKIALQIAFGGSQNTHPEGESMNILAPSAVRNRVSGLMPKEAGRDDIRRITGLFGDAAWRAKEAGFDAVQVHAAHGYFLSSFLSPFYNRRKDEYNGTIHERARIIYETYTEIRERVGNDFPVIFKLNCDDFMDEGEGMTPGEAIEVFKRLDEMGADFFEVSGCNESSGKSLAPARREINSPEKESYFKDATAKIAAAVSVPVILMGGNRSPERMEKIFDETDISLFSLGRPLLCEPDLIKHWEEDISHKPKCVSCNQCWATEPNSCIFNRK